MAQMSEDELRKTMLTCTLEEIKAALVKVDKGYLSAPAKRNEGHRWNEEPLLVAFMVAAVSTKRARATPHAPNAASAAGPVTVKCEGSGSK